MSANVKNTRVYARYPLQRPDPVLWKFENPLTDYPRNINYMRMGNDTVYVWTELDVTMLHGFSNDKN
jgi:hypothetical protein